MLIHDLAPNPGSRHTRKRIGRGEGSGHGKTSTRGMKGAKARDQVPPGFEGGQTPLHRRLPVARGFRNRYGTVYSTVNVGKLEAFGSEEVITPEILIERRMVKRLQDGIKILGDGKLSHAVTVRAHRVSESARQKIEAAGGKIELIGSGGGS